MTRKMKPYWIYDEDFFRTHNENGTSVYDVLLAELTPYLKQGTVKVVGQDFTERRLTCYFTSTDTQMTYSGRVLEVIRPPPNSYISNLLSVVNSQEFRKLLVDRYQTNSLNVEFNSVFINWYRPPSITDKPDYLGPHSDDEKYLTLQVILSVTYCEKLGARVFRFHDRSQGNKIKEEFELQDGSLLLMLEGCQKLYKHSVSERKYNLNKQLITGGRLNLTFRCVKV